MPHPGRLSSRLLLLALGLVSSFPAKNMGKNAGCVAWDSYRRPMKSKLECAEHFLRKLSPMLV